MIIGVGVDIVDIERIDSLLRKFGEHFIRKIYTPAEVCFCRKRVEIGSALAKMYALKEATIKALSDAKGIRWHDIEVLHDRHGKPVINLSGVALAYARTKSKHFNIQASVSDEKQYAIAYVVVETCDVKVPA